MATKRIRFVTDSTCDLPEAVIDQYQISVVPTYVNIGEESFADDGKQLDRADYYNRLPTLTPFPTTAAPSPGVAKQFIEAAFADADHIIIITAPARLSAIYEAMRLGAADLPPDQVTLLDGQSVTMALGYQVQIGAEVAEETGDVDQVIAAIKKVQANCLMSAMIDSLDNLRRSGRINLAAAGIGSLLQIKPIVTISDSDVVVLARVRTAKRAREDLINRIREQAPLERLSLLHSNNPEGLAWMRGQVVDIAPDTVYEININPTLGTHVGAHCLGFVTVKQNWRL